MKGVKMTSLEKVLKEHKAICEKAYSVVESKGKDYSRTQHEDGDTLANITNCKTLDITDSVCQGLLVRLSDKFSRLISLTRDPNVNPAVIDEKVTDTIEDSINYLVYLKIKYDEERSHKSQIIGTHRIDPAFKPL